MQIGDERKVRKFECRVETGIFYSTTKYIAHFNVCKHSLRIKKPKPLFQIDVYVFGFQTPSAVQKIKQLLKDKPEHVSINSCQLVDCTEILAQLTIAKHLWLTQKFEINTEEFIRGVGIFFLEGNA